MSGLSDLHDYPITDRIAIARDYADSLSPSAPSLNSPSAEPLPSAGDGADLSTGVSQ
jgi:hypothetical protein